MITLTQLRPYTGDIVAPSPNHGTRKAPVIEGIVLHATADEGNEAGSLTWLRSPKSQASCHLLVSRNGKVIRLVGDRHRAWHAGGARWRGTSDVNSVTLGIEIANRNDGEPFTDAQYGRVAAIVAHYCRQGLSLDDVVGHGDIDAEGVADPFGWDWDRFRAMVQHQLPAADVEGRRGIVYDRRSGERIAADEAAAYGSTDVAPPADVQVPPDVQDRADVRARADVHTPADAPRRAPAAPPPARAAETRGAVQPAAPAPSAADRRPAPAAPRQQPAKVAVPKPALRSRTIWLNGLTVLAAAGVMVSDTLDLAFSVGLTLPQEITTWALFFVGMVNIILRFRTTGPIGSSPGGVHRLPPDVLVERRSRPRT